jgi:hypothetical protein
LRAATLTVTSIRVIITRMIRLRTIGINTVTGFHFSSLKV